MKKVLNAFVYLVVLALSILFIWYGNQYIHQNNASQGLIYDREEELDTFVFAKITSIDETSDAGNPDGKILFSAKTFDFGGGPQEVVQGTQVLNGNNKNMVPVSKGDRVILLSYGSEYLFQNYFRLDKVAILGAAIIGLLLLLGGVKGFNTVVSLGLTCLSIFFIFIPAIKAGYNIYLATGIISLYIILVTLVIVYGLDKKSIITAFSCAAGVAFSCALSLLIGRWMKMTGYFNDNTYMLDTLLGVDVDMEAIMFSMITIGALGAIMDVSMSVASPLCEYKKSNRGISAAALMKYGFSIGRDFMGTMTNTLILAYMGSSLIVVLIYAASNYPLLSILNKEEIVFEFLQSLIGCLGILFTIPLTTILASVLLSGEREPPPRQTGYRQRYSR
jgi:uncharacterized membrane protein